MKRYSVFVSSTKNDLEKERDEIIRVIIELQHMPASMEYFPASSKRSWEHIKRVIDESDYFVLILASRYGSIDSESGMSFSEREFRYARNIGVPTIAFLHQDPESLPSRDHDNDERFWEFYNYVKGISLCRFWDSSSNLASMASTSLVRLIDDYPRPGWLRADNLPDLYRDHPIADFLEANIWPLTGQPYRESVEARVEYSEANDARFLHVVDEVSYKCRMVNGTIDQNIFWSFTRDEYSSMNRIHIKIKKPSGEECILLDKNLSENSKIYTDFEFSHEITNEWNVDKLLVVVEAYYVIPSDHFVSWEMPKTTYGFALTITYPKDLEIFHIAYLNALEDCNVTDRNGFFSYKFYTWALPNEGLAWQFSRKNAGSH